MKPTLNILVISFLWSVSTTWASSDVENFEKLTGANIGILSAKLSEYKKQFSEIERKRIGFIVWVERKAAEGRLEVDHQVNTLKQTGGTPIVKVFDAIRDHADKAANAPAQLDMVETQVNSDIMAAYKPLLISSEKLDEAARLLASLAKGRSNEFFISYLQDVRENVERLNKESKASKTSGDQALNAKVDEVKISNSLEQKSPAGSNQ